MTSPTIETSLEKVLGQINQKLDTLQKDVTDIKVGQVRLEAELKGEIKALDERLTGEIKTLDERLTGEVKALDERLTGEIKTLNANVTGLSNRLDNQEFISRGILVALIVAILGGLAKLFGFIGNP